jgi:hypothetical protein
MGKRQTSFGKRQRERDKKAKAAAKAERKAERTEQFGTELVDAADQASIIEALDRLHHDFDEGRISTDDFETRREELLNKLTVD